MGDMSTPVETDEAVAVETDEAVHIARMIDDFFACPPHPPSSNHEEWLLRTAHTLMQREAHIVSGEEREGEQEQGEKEAISKKGRRRMEDAFLQRLANVHSAFHVRGRSVLDAILKTCREMLSDRKCTDIHVSSDPVGDIVAGRPALWSNESVVYVHTEDRIGVKFARAVVEQEPHRLCVCLSIDGPTAFTRNEFSGRNIQFMLCKSLFVNVTRHSLVPTHTLIDATKGETCPYDKAHLPLLMETDPIVQYFHWPVDGIVRIDRVFGGDEPIPYYRRIHKSS